MSDKFDGMSPPAPSLTVSPAQARRIALAAQGFGRPHPAVVGTRQLNLAIGRLGLLQLDSVNVFERSHYLPLFARLGSYDRASLDRLAFGRRSDYIEYWAHEAAIFKVEDWPLFRWRMDAFRAKYSSIEGGWVQQNPDMLDWLRAELADKGPLAASEIQHDANKRRGPWWGWSDIKYGLEFLFMFGEVVSAGRTRFERSYGLAEHLLPSEVLDSRVARHDAVRELLRTSTRAHGIGTARDFADYYRIRQAPALAALRELEEEGEIVRVSVPGWAGATWLHRDARIPRRIDAAALLSPFDPVVWERARAERMFGFHYRIEIYTPAPKRVFGYYSLPILLDDALVGRIDLKSDRQRGVLMVQSAWSEVDAPPDVAERIVPVLRRAAEWQGLGEIEVVGRGTLAAPLAAELAVSGLS